MSTAQVFAFHKKVRRLVTPLRFPVLALALMSVWPSGTLAQDDHSHTVTPQQRGQQSALLKIVREATERFKDVAEAEREGYVLQFGCVSGPDAGAMGLHYVNGALVGQGILDARRPQIVIYEPLPNGGKKLIGADFLLFADKWNQTHSSPPELMGQLFHLFDAPNRFGLPAFYTLHVWAWKDNPNGAFVNWHPNVSCQTFEPAP